MEKLTQPNILICMTDQQRWDSLGCYGIDFIKTPHLDRLASEGRTFDNCYVNNPICTPSRASLFTGKHVPEHGVLRLHDILPDEEKLFPWHLKNLGYTTALFGKLHVSGRIEEEKRRHPHDGFDIYEWCMEASISLDSPLNGYAAWLKEKDIDVFNALKEQGRKLKHIPREYHFTQWAAERTCSFIEQHDQDSPFFCMMSLFDPHNPYDDVPSEYLERVDTSQLPPRRIHPSEDPFTIRGIRQEQVDGYLGEVSGFTEEDFTAMKEGYYASVCLIDDAVGQVLDTLERKGMKDNTLVIFVSDHGDMLGDHNLVVKGAYFYDACTKVPCILRYPGNVVPGERSDALVQPHDIASTVLKAAGVEEKEITSLMPDSLDLCSADIKGHETVVCAYRETGIAKTGRYFTPSINATMIRDERYKLNVYHSEKGVDDAMSGQLFDMISDPGETDDLWEKNPEERADLLGKLLEWNMNLDTPRKARSAVPEFDQLFDNRL